MRRTGVCLAASASLIASLVVPAAAQPTAPVPTTTASASPTAEASTDPSAQLSTGPSDQPSPDPSTEPSQEPTPDPEPRPPLGSADNPVTLDPAAGQWALTRGRWWWRNNDGSYPHSAWAVLDGRTYYFDGAGWMAAGWSIIDHRWHYFAGSGAHYAGWAYLGGAWYFLDPADHGTMRSGWFLDGTTWYYANGSGAMQTGWLATPSGWYYLTGSGAMAKGWVHAGSTWYYMDPETGLMRTGWFQDGDTWYYANASGAMHTGWVQGGSGWYFMSGSGAMAKGWVHTNGNWYYMDPETGLMRTGWFQDGDTWYYANASGAMHTGWVQGGSGWYFMSGSGAMAKGWVHTNGNWYYMDPDSGLMRTGTVIVDGKEYTLAPTGEWRGYSAPAGYLQVKDQITPLGWQTNSLTSGMNGVKVRIVRWKLGLPDRTLSTVDVAFMRAVRNFQRRAGLPQTGVVDERTWNAMGTGYSWYVDQYQATPVGLEATRSQRIEAMIAYALEQQGSSYTWGGAGPYSLGFDCSGLVLQSLYRGGMDPQPINVIKHSWPTYRTSQELYAYPYFQHVSLGQRQRGDLIFYQSGGTIVHVALYLGGDQVMHTDMPGRPARVQNMYSAHSGIVSQVVRPFP